MCSEEDILEIERLERSVNGQIGVSCVRTILLYLRKNQFDVAQQVRVNEGDKTRVYPELENTLTRIFGCRLHRQQNCQDSWCQRTLEP